MSDTPEEFLAYLAGQPWRPRSMLAPARDPMRLRSRISILAAIAVLHLLAGHGLMLMLATRDRAAPEAELVVDFIEWTTAPAPASPRPSRKLAAPRANARAPTPPEALQAIQPRSIQPRSNHGSDHARELQLYTPEGRLRTPGDLLDQLDRQVGDKRVFSYQVPRMDDARKLFYRNPPVAYQSTRFEQYWKPDQDLLSDLLTQLVEKTTKEIRIPVPGQPGSAMVCQVSLLALGGGCGVLTNGADYVGPLDDPDTLDPAEDRQCQAWWNQIIGAATQEIWRKTRSLYEAECRKPLLRRR